MPPVTDEEETTALIHLFLENTYLICSRGYVIIWLYKICK